MDLSEFLLARFDEDEYEARGRSPRAGYDNDWSEEHRTHLLTDCYAKRRIVNEVTHHGWEETTLAADVLALLALPYSDHPDYRAEWRPSA